MAVTVEAVSPVYDAYAGETAKNRIPLLQIIEDAAPAGWGVAVWELPNIGPADSKTQPLFRRKNVPAARSAMYAT